MTNYYTLKPQRRRLKDYNWCFYGHQFKEENKNPLEYGILQDFLKTRYMEIVPFVEPGRWLWTKLIENMERSAFCVFETNSGNRNVHNVVIYLIKIMGGLYRKSFFNWCWCNKS